VIAASPFGQVVELFRETLRGFPDKRTGKNTHYKIEDAALSAFSVFFLQTPSFLAFQREMQEIRGENNAQSIFGMHEIPSDNQIRALLDEVPPDRLVPLYWQIFNTLEAAGYLAEFRSLGGSILLALDGTQYFSSTAISCDHCSKTTTKSGKITYSHTAVTPVIVSPSKSQVISLPPEFIVPQDGHQKQDCEISAAKRWIKGYSKQLQKLDIVILGDDLYSHQPFCELLIAEGLGFILNCKPESHKILYEFLSVLEPGKSLRQLSHQRWTGKHHETFSYRYANHLPIRDGDGALSVNWCEIIITNHQGKALYKNSFVTNLLITDENVANLAVAGRTRWKIENENNNTLKTKGYNLEHNFGHGKKHLSSLLASFNILAFLFHTLLEALDQKYQILRQKLPSRKALFESFRALTQFLFFDDWDHLLNFMIQGLERKHRLNTS
jgi:hypothetical protein